ncbi:MAG: methyltransferase domain-containing protein [Candidatus Berkelbacteria bacterium]|nr:methyltransferase domain-containing protein [Candidatus Berkelbacteria bacterium]
MKRHKFLNFGSGERRIKNAFNVDVNEYCKPDLVWDLNKTPYPFEKNRFEKVYCYDILEHLDDLLSVMGELHRICKPSAKIIIEAPHFSFVNAYTDPTHKHFFSLGSFDYFTESNQWKYYTENKFRFKPIKKKIVFQKGLFKKCLERFFNAHPKLYESKFAWLVPAEKIELVLEVIKEH